MKKESAIWGSERERRQKIIYIGMIRKIYNMAQVTKKN